jgi:hypothetical protein
VDKEPLNEKEFSAQGSFGLRIGFGERPALIIIDLAEAFTNQKAMLGANLDKAIVAPKPLRGGAYTQDAKSSPGNISDSKATLTLNETRLPCAGISWHLPHSGATGNGSQVS